MQRLLNSMCQHGTARASVAFLSVWSDSNSDPSCACSVAACACMHCGSYSLSVPWATSTRRVQRCPSHPGLCMRRIANSRVRLYSTPPTCHHTCQITNIIRHHALDCSSTHCSQACVLDIARCMLHTKNFVRDLSSAILRLHNSQCAMFTSSKVHHPNSKCGYRM